MDKVVKALFSPSSPRARMAATAFGAGIYALCMLATRPRHIHDGVWGVIVFAALVWGFVESGRSVANRPVAADGRSQLKVG